MYKLWECLPRRALWEEHELIHMDHGLRCGDSTCGGGVVPMGKSTSVLHVYEDTVMVPLYPRKEFP